MDPFFKKKNLTCKQGFSGHTTEVTTTVMDRARPVFDEKIVEFLVFFSSPAPLPHLHRGNTPTWPY